jgi:hypothetical protein
MSTLARELEVVGLAVVTKYDSVKTVMVDERGENRKPQAVRVHRRDAL